MVSALGSSKITEPSAKAASKSAPSFEEFDRIDDLKEPTGLSEDESSPGSGPSRGQSPRLEEADLSYDSSEGEKKVKFNEIRANEFSKIYQSLTPRGKVSSDLPKLEEKINEQVSQEPIPRVRTLPIPTDTRKITNLAQLEEHKTHSPKLLESCVETLKLKLEELSKQENVCEVEPILGKWTQCVNVGLKMLEQERDPTLSLYKRDEITTFMLCLQWLMQDAVAKPLVLDCIKNKSDELASTLLQINTLRARLNPLLYTKIKIEETIDKSKTKRRIKDISLQNAHKYITHSQAADALLECSFKWIIVSNSQKKIKIAPSKRDLSKNFYENLFKALDELGFTKNPSKGKRVTAVTHYFSALRKERKSLRKQVPYFPILQCLIGQKESGLEALRKIWKFIENLEDTKSHENFEISMREKSEDGAEVKIKEDGKIKVVEHITCCFDLNILKVESAKRKSIPRIVGTAEIAQFSWKIGIPDVTKVCKTMSLRVKNLTFPGKIMFKEHKDEILRFQKEIEDGFKTYQDGVHELSNRNTVQAFKKFPKIINQDSSLVHRNV